MGLGAMAPAALASRAAARAPLTFKEIFSSSSPRIPYGSGKSQFGELRLPSGAGPHPVAIVIHGGFWGAGYGLDLMDALSAAISLAGIATWNVEYRRVGEAGGGWPGTFRDVAAAADHVRVLARAHPLDLARVASIGHSAGGHLALWLAGRRRIWKTDPLFDAASLPLAAAVSLAGVPDLARAARERVGGRAVPALLGGSPGEVPERYAAGSPAELLPLGTAQVLLHGDRDDIVPFDLSHDYAGRAKAAGDDARLVRLAAAGHFEVIDPRTGPGRQAVEALRSALKP